MPSRFLRLALRVLPLGALLMIAACTQDSDPSGPAGPGPNAAPASLTIVGAAEGQVGAAAPLQAVVRAANGDTLSVPVSWSSSDTARVRVSAGGVVTPARIASVRIIASAGAARDTLSFTSRLAPFTFVFADTVPEPERDLVRDAIQDAHAFQRMAFEKTLADSITISGTYSASGCAQGGAAAFASGRSITFCLGNPGWKNHGPGIRQKIVHHELFHLWQFAHWSADPAKSPAWLLEGAAELIGFYGIANRGRVKMDVALGCQVKESSDFATRQPPGLPPLQNVEAKQAFQSTQGPLYTHSMLGAHYLVEEGDGIAALEIYGNAVKTNATWQAAFQQAFKITPAAFYGAFPGYVSGLAVPAAYDCRF